MTLIYVGIIIIVILLGIIIHNLRSKSQRKVKNPSTYGKRDSEPQQSHINIDTQTSNQIHLNKNDNLDSQQQSVSSNLGSSIKSTLNNLNNTLNKNLNGENSDSDGNTPQIISPATIIIVAVVIFIILPMMFSMTYNALDRTLKHTTQPIERFNHRMNQKNRAINSNETVTKPTQAIYDEEDPQIKPDMVRQGHLVNGLENLQDQRSKALGILSDRQGQYISSNGHDSLYITRGAHNRFKMIITKPNTQTPIENAQIMSCQLGQHAGVIISGIDYTPIHNNPKNLKADSFQDLIIFNRNNKNLEITRDTYPMLNQNQPTESQGSNLISTKINAQRFTFR